MSEGKEDTKGGKLELKRRVLRCFLLDITEGLVRYQEGS